jgi:hypothetical protein
MKERFEVGRSVEITAFLPKHKILDKECSRSDMLAKPLEFTAQKQAIAEEKAEDQNGDQGGKDSADSPGVEFPEAKVPMEVSLIKNPRDEITGDHEKDVHATKPTGKNCGKSVIEDDAQNSHSTKPVNVGTVLEVGCMGFADHQTAIVVILRNPCRTPKSQLAFAARPLPSQSDRFSFDGTLLPQSGAALAGCNFVAVLRASI